ncbi:hypothetical protein LOS15_02640 [Halomonas sp. 7T]|uniref:DUF6602 domain-containing protein n=1 Tax=Halomonas sp. 7T TaxID=2893469 RepID=UPI0021D94FCE|nr:DUF6602 domain-containing protein [Halomonas sp. 7T]UXZ54950.1 hypothetical protein LOS15_02640 [Halomonas sp. 7T]
MSVNRFYKIEQEMLLLEAEKVSLFTKHNPSIGSYREAVLRDYIRKFLPSTIEVKSGFIAKNDNQDEISNSQSRQVDLLIYSNEKFIPLLETDDFSVVRPESFLGCIEVKSTLTFYKEKRPNGSKETNKDYPFGGGYTEAYRWSGTLVDALKNIQAAAHVCRDKERTYYSGIIAYSSTFDPHKVYEALDNGDLQEQLGLNHLKELPMNICVIGNFITLFSHVELIQEHGKCYEDSHYEYESYYNEISVSGEDFQYPLQFFSVNAHNQICYLHSGKAPDDVGLFSAMTARMKFRMMHFDLMSDGI